MPKVFSMVKQSSSRLFVSLAVGVLIVAFALRVWDLGSASYWVDEVFTHEWNEAPLDEFFSLILRDGVHTPLYFLWARLFPTASEMTVRLSAALPGVIGVALLMGVTRRLYHSATMALWAGALLAVNPYHIWLSRMARPYSAVFVVALLTSYFFLILLRGERSRRNWLAFALSTVALYMTHYFGVFVSFAEYILLVFVLHRDSGFFRRWVAVQAAALAPLVIWLVALTQVEFNLGISWIPTPTLEDIPLTFWTMTVGYDGPRPGYLVIGLILAAIGLLVGAVYAWHERRVNRANFYWLCLVVAPWAIVFAISAYRPLYIDRYFMIFLPGLLLLIVSSWMRLPRPSWRALSAAGFVLICVANVVVTMRSDYDEREDWRDAVAYTQAQLQPGDGVLFESTISLRVFHHYFEGDLDSISIFGVTDAEGQEPYPLSEKAEISTDRLWALYRIPQGSAHYLGIMRKSFDPFSLQPKMSPMSIWVYERQDQIIDYQKFNGVNVYLLGLQGEPLVRLQTEE